MASESHLKATAEPCLTHEFTKGVDVSKWQGAIDWQRVNRNAATFVFVRVSDGLHDLDPYFADNFRGVSQAGLVRGVYQFFRARHDPIEQADLMLQWLDEAGGFAASDIPPALAIETLDGQSVDLLRARARAWLLHVKQALGVVPLVYTNIDFAERLSGHLADFPLWLAHWKSPDHGACPAQASGYTTWTFWQYTDGGDVTGIEGAVDLNFFNGDEQQLREFVARSHTLSLSNLRH